MKQLSIAVLLVSTLAAPAFADQAAGDKCAAGLDGDAKTIYAAAAPGFVGASDPRSLVADTTKGLVMSGAISRGTARSAAEAAGACLTKLR
ncbi:hypothetical protein EZH22_06645 [Xanthobacter dioxanivorans]|uniref:Uncharacterized protein n=1 Tax=Xanthobacter dioxanivorans TaxID=2528964 RepID=A0A974SJ46_9HYPH|nr:hypothetical protein [Xanthobacter dioxanivorans]QRG08021.1 hypothetical protein EZH22_06645 [Xanthobacter dioxanivorans]